MADTSNLAVQLANSALTEVSHPAHAATALMTAAATILQRDFGPHVAAELMLAAVVEARTGLVGSGIVAEVVVH